VTRNIARLTRNYAALCWQLLFTDFKITYPLPLKRGQRPSAKKEVLETIQDTQPHPLVGIILAWRTLDGLRKTVDADGRYITKCERHVDVGKMQRQLTFVEQTWTTFYPISWC
jgi:hypothetical protein